MGEMNVKYILAAWLKEHGYDGLFNSDGPCGCLVDDLIPCGGNPDECSPGYKVECKPEECENCHGCDGGPLYGEGTWRVQGERP